ncbi:class I SAM-dependent methyltransferase [Pseudomonadales bacterium]|nr:class I SAM-dependent methyltransferase [Pseudomonadales bacterium]
MSKRLDEIAKATVTRYSERFRTLGRDVRALGWGSKEQQDCRFEQVLRALPIEGKSLLDIGCGFGDFLSYCSSFECTPSKYIGWDINHDLIDEAKIQHPSSSFEVLNLADRLEVVPVAEVGVMLGVLNFNFKYDYDNKAFTKMMIEKAFTAVSKTLVVDFLSTFLTLDYPEEGFVYYHDPSEMLAFGLQLTPNVRLLHNYAPIPQKEFMLVLDHV